MVFTRKKRQSNRRLFSQLDDFDQDIPIPNTMSDRRGNAAINEGTVDQDFGINNSGSNSATNQNLVNVKTLERYFNEGLIKKWVILSILSKMGSRTQFRRQSIVLLLLKLN